MNSKNLIISVYKTSISEKDLLNLKSVLDNFNKDIKWSTDLDDVENILRIESQYEIEKEIITSLQALK